MGNVTYIGVTQVLDLPGLTTLDHAVKRLESMNLLRRKQRPVMGGYKSTLYELSVTSGVVSQGDSVSGRQCLNDTGVVSL